MLLYIIIVKLMQQKNQFFLSVSGLEKVSQDTTQNQSRRLFDLYQFV